MATWNGCSAIVALCVILSTILHLSIGLTKPSSIKLTDNGYTGITIAIHPNEEEREDLIEAIKQMINNASVYMYTASKQRAYLKEVIILVPETWEDKPEYESPRNATFEGADVIVAPRNPRYAPKSTVPYTKHYEGCGKQGTHIHLTNHFLLDEDVEGFYGNRGRVFVHEWGHYRWGLFNEYSDDIADHGNAKVYYFSDDKRAFFPTLCARNYNVSHLIWREGRRYDVCEGNATIGYEYGCIPFVRSVQNDVTASIMSGQLARKEIVNFCDDDVFSPERHNREAPNKHNRLCNGRSSWEIMREHIDFKDENNLPRTIADVTPTIIVARKRSVRVVAVLDSSGSMQFRDRISKLAGAARNFLTSIALSGSFVGIVDFDSDATILTGLTLIDSDETRRQIADLVPTEARGGTCIGKGLDAAFQVFVDHGESPSGGRVLLISDGIDTDEDCDTLSWISKYVDESIVIDTVAFTDEASYLLVDLQTQTGGKFYLQTDEPGSTGLHDAFLATMESGLRDYDRRVVLMSTSTEFEVDESKHFGVYIDPTVGRKTSFDFTFTAAETAAVAVDVIITSPDGMTYTSSYIGYGVDLSFSVISVKFQMAEPGLWSFDVLNVHSEKHEVFIAITTFAANEQVDPITATSELSGSITDFANGENLIAFAEVRQGLYPVILAEVIATIERPNDELGNKYEPVMILLEDNGAGADVTKHDGIYSAYFTNYTGKGYYGVKVDINNENGNAIVLDDSEKLPFSRTVISVDPDELLKGNLPTSGNTTLYLPGMAIPLLTGSPAPRFNRGISGGSSRVPETPLDWTPDKDIIPPSTIVDLRVASAFYNNGTVVLEFTAPGGDLDHGNASYYVMRMSSSHAEIQANYSDIPDINATDILYGDFFSPRKSGNREKIVVRVSIPGNPSVSSYTFAMHAVDESSNEGRRSNLAQATFRRTIPQPPPPPTTAQITSELPDETATPVTNLSFGGDMTQTISTSHYRSTEIGTTSTGANTKDGTTTQSYTNVKSTIPPALLTDQVTNLSTATPIVPSVEIVSPTDAYNQTTELIHTTLDQETKEPYTGPRGRTTTHTYIGSSDQTTETSTRSRDQMTETNTGTRETFTQTPDQSTQISNDLSTQNQEHETTYNHISTKTTVPDRTIEANPPTVGNRETNTLMAIIFGVTGIVIFIIVVYVIIFFTKRYTEKIQSV